MPSDEPIAWICEIRHRHSGGWQDHISHNHPDEVFNHIEYRNVRGLMEVADGD